MRTEGSSTSTKPSRPTACWMSASARSSSRRIRPTAELVPFEHWPVNRALRGERRTCAEYTIRRKDLGVSWVGSYSFAPIRDGSGRIAGTAFVQLPCEVAHPERRRGEHLRALCPNVGHLLLVGGGRMRAVRSARARSALCTRSESARPSRLSVTTCLAEEPQCRRTPEDCLRKADLHELVSAGSVFGVAPNPSAVRRHVMQEVSEWKPIV